MKKKNLMVGGYKQAIKLDMIALTDERVHKRVRDRDALYIRAMQDLIEGEDTMFAVFDIEEKVYQLLLTSKTVNGILRALRAI